MRNGFKVLLALLFIIAAAVLVLLSPVFEVNAVDIKGNSRVSAYAIKQAAELDKPQNIFFYSAGKARRDLLKNTYIAGAGVAKDYLAKSVEISVQERRLSGYVDFLPDAYIYIDDKGYVLETSKTMKDKLPVIEGLAFTRFAAGMPLDVSNGQALDAVVTLEQLFNKYNLQSLVSKLDVSDTGHVHAYIKNLDFDLGEVVDADQKVHLMQQIYRKLGDADVRATIDLTDANKDSLFQLLK